MSPELIKLADMLWAARDAAQPCCETPDLPLADAYAVAAHNHRRRVGAGERPCGRKIGHTHAAQWPALQLSGPSWGWIYQASTHRLTDPRPLLTLGPRREARLEPELVLHLGRTPRAGAGASEWADCVDQIAIGLELVDRPYAAWGFSVPASVAAGGVHAALFIGPTRPFGAAQAAALANLRAELRLDSERSSGGSALVLGSPLEALAQLSALLQAQGAPALQAGEWITSGALAPALPVRAGMVGEVGLTGLDLSPLVFSVR